ncbi:MAG: hypothetical protein A2X49_09330 [Lentisphaerae bacterium GWF2_52_8]|nr:MAG: hypothetical protein A2X49_09330 [Lentisphaerae bacterium GWF2_52_8]
MKQGVFDLMDMKCSFKAGSVIGGKFEVIKRVGEGSLGDDIYLGTQQDLKRQVMIHILPRDVSADREMVQRFVQEIQFTAALQHPNIIPAYEAGEHLGRAYLITASADGEKLGQFIAARGGKLDEKEALQLAIPLAEALDYAWTKLKVLHRNICPESIIIAPGMQPLISDFGMAKTLGESAPELTMAGFTIGNPQYMSTEQVRGQSDLDCRSDIYCLGLLLYEMLSGHPAVQGTNQVAMMESQINGVPPSLAEGNPALSTAAIAIVEKTLKKKREDRYQDWTSLVTDLKAVLKGERPSVIAVPESASEAPLQAPNTVAAVSSSSLKGTQKAKPKNEKISWLILAAIILGTLLLAAVIIGILNADEKRREELAKTRQLAWEKAVSNAEAATKNSENPDGISAAISNFESFKAAYPNSKYEKLADIEIRLLKEAQSRAATKK